MTFIASTLIAPTVTAQETTAQETTAQETTAQESDAQETDAQKHACVKLEPAAALCRYLLVSLVCLASLALADESFDVETQAAVCMSCHGMEGQPISHDIPIIAGQQYYYLYVQLKDYKAGRRDNAIMSGMVKEMDKDAMKALAEHFAGMEWPRVVQEIDDSKVESGENSTVAGQCSQCHSTYQGDSRIPRLAGQHLPYLSQTMKDFKHKVRLNSPAKGSLMNSYDDADIESIAHFLSGL